MEIYKKVIDLIFPSFEKPKESRFNKFFSENQGISSLGQKLQLNGHKIFTGEDRRTTILIQNIPRTMTKNQLKLILEKIANINYIYIPLFMLSKENLRCAFVNVVNSKSIIDIYLKLKKLNFIYDNPNTKIEICYRLYKEKEHLLIILKLKEIFSKIKRIIFINRLCCLE